MNQNSLLSHIELKIPPLLLTIIFVFFSWISTGFDISNILRISLATLLFVAGIFVLLAGVIRFRSSETTVNPIHPENATHLVESGVFSFTRNPMYLGCFLLLIAWSIFLNSLVAVTLNFLFPVYLTLFQIKPEERALRKMFGEAYDEYCKKVPRWI